MKYYIISLLISQFTFFSFNKNQKTNFMKQENYFKISFEFNADAKRVFEMWINPDLFSRWLGPDGAIMKFLNTNFQEGETSLWTMTTPDGLTKFGQITYKTIQPFQLLIYTQNFCDEHGNFIKAPFSATYPDYLLTTVTFSESKTKTTVHVKWEIFGEATHQEIETFNGMKENMKTGWTMSFVKLENLLNETR